MAPKRATTGGRKRRRASPTTWSRATLARMPLERKLGQLLVLPVFNAPDAKKSGSFRKLAAAVADWGIGGLLVMARPGPAGLERGRAGATAALLNALQRRARIPLLVAADFEAGTAARLADGTAFPHAMAVAAGGNPDDAFAIGKITAEEARAAGIQWVFAPVADVNNNPDNPIINIRSFGESPAAVGEFAAAFVRGVAAGGALACAKHFPGHGDTDMDSHLGLPVIRGDRGRLEAVEIPPFRAAAAAGAGSIMLGHLAVPALEPDPGVPATFSRAIIGGLLRNELGFDGVVVTDALTMDALAALGSPAEAAARAIAAGADMLLLPPDPGAALDALRKAVEEGRLPLARINEAVGRILRAKARLGLPGRRMAGARGWKEVFARPEPARLAEEIAARGITLLRDSAGLVPLAAHPAPRLLLAAISADPDPAPGKGLEEELRRRVNTLTVVRADSRFLPPGRARLPRPEEYDLAIVALFVRVADRKGTVSLPGEAAALAKRVLAEGKPAVVASFGSPYLVARFPEARSWLAAFTTREPAERAMAAALFGETAISGRLPVTVPGVAPVGAGLRRPAADGALKFASRDFGERLRPALRLLDGAVRHHAFPGGALAIGHEGRLLVHRFGGLTYGPAADPARADTIYDLASLTKPVATTTAVMLLLAAGKLRLGDFAAEHLGEWSRGPQPGWRARVTIEDLLRHSSGLPAHREYYKRARGAAAILAQVFAEPLEYEPGTRIVYSDLGFMLLGAIVERLSGFGLDPFARERIFDPLGMSETLFKPPRSLRRRIAPTERERGFRRRLVRGEVHDQNAWAMGGIAGHAGLFSTAGDLAVFCQMMLQKGSYAGRQILPGELVEQCGARKTIGRTARGLGWDVPTPPSSSGRYFSRSSFGHIGFTGTSCWIDPEKALFVVLLTNRIYPSARNRKIRAVWPAFHDAVLRSLGVAGAKRI